ncbi:hypothetical protein LPJ66_007392, partial [Kickxella alabastrina]
MDYQHSNTNSGINSNNAGALFGSNASSPKMYNSEDDARIKAHHYSETVDFQRMRASLDEAITQGVSKVLVIYTGGTIGMKHDNSSGYSPVRGYLPEKLRSIGRFHDPDGFKDFEFEFHRSSAVNSYTAAAAATGQANNDPGNAKRVQPAGTSSLLEAAKQRLREMTRGHMPSPRPVAPKENATSARNSVKSETCSPPASAIETHDPNTGDNSTPHGDSSRVFEDKAPTMTSPGHVKFDTSSIPPSSIKSGSADLGGEDDPRGKGTPSCLSEWLITPKSMYGRRIQYCFLEYDPLLDSCNMDMTDWVRIVTDIERFYYTFDAFIILHGTDTMAYTASALSFMLQSLGKSVIVTGSQVPIAEVRNDGIENFLGALTIAGHFVIPEVSLYFNNKLFRGNRCVKIDAMDFDAFSSPNLAPLVKVGVDIEVNWPEVLRPNAIEPFCAYKQMNTNVANLRLFPGISASAVRAFLAPPIQGIVLETFGAGNAPDARPAILEALADASERGVVIVNVTQCQRGNVSDLYATARGLTTAKVVPGRDMTSECALTKLSYLLGRGLSPERCRELLGRSLRGELTIVQSHSRPIFSTGNSRSHTFTQFVSRQILDETQANEPNIELPTSRMHVSMSPPIPGGTGSPQLVGIHPSGISLAKRSIHGTDKAAALAEGSNPRSRETVTERASIYRAFFPVLLCAAAATGDLQ